MKTMSVIVLWLLTTQIANGTTQPWDPDQIIAADCHLKRGWPHPTSPLPREIQEKGITKAMTAKVEEEKQKWHKARMASYHRHLAARAESNYYYANKEIHRAMATLSANPKEQATFALLHNTNATLLERRTFKDGIKMIVCEANDSFIIYYGSYWRPGQRHGLYSLAVVIDKKSGDISSSYMGAN